jgi:hypothetical protein
VLFGSRTNASQRVTDCLRYILKEKGVHVINYIDDLIRRGFDAEIMPYVCPTELAESRFQITRQLLADLNLQVSPYKTILSGHA